MYTAVSWFYHFLFHGEMDKKQLIIALSISGPDETGWGGLALPISKYMIIWKKNTLIHN